MRERIEEFVERDYAKVVAAIGIVTDEPDLADEGVQAALVKVATGTNDYDAFAARVAIVATGEVRLLARRRSNQQMSGISPSRPEGLPPPLVQEAPIVDAVRELSQRQREMALMYFYLGASIDDIAEVSYLNPSTVETHIDQARRLIAEYLVNAPNISSQTSAGKVDPESEDTPPRAVGE